MSIGFNPTTNNGYHLNAGGSPKAPAHLSLDNIGFDTRPDSSYTQAYQVRSENLANLLGVPKDQHVYVADAAAAEALNYLDNPSNLDDTQAAVWEGPPSRLGAMGDFLWGTKVREA